MQKFLAVSVLFVMCSPVLAKRHHGIVYGKASWDQRTSHMVTACRGLNRGAVLRVWNPSKPNHKIILKVNDACGGGMRGMGRVLDLSTGAFKKLYGSLSHGTGHVAYQVIKNGKGHYCGHR